MYTCLDLDTVDSTNSWAKRELSGFDGPTFITAREQTSGRGRFGNCWISPKDQNLLLTFVEPLRPSLQLLHYLQAACLAIQKLLHSKHIEAQVKWPNDLLVDQEKIAGILVEETSKKDQPWVIVGIGLNINMDETDLQKIEKPATSMKKCLKGPIYIEKVKHEIIDLLLETVQWAEHHPVQCVHKWQQACSWIIGSYISVRSSSKRITGTVEAIAEDGSLVMRLDDGSVTTVNQGMIE